MQSSLLLVPSLLLSQVVRIVRVLRDAQAAHDSSSALRNPLTAPPPGSTAQADAYAVLDVAADISAADIKRRYMRLSLQIHPDKCLHKVGVHLSTGWPTHPGTSSLPLVGLMQALPHILMDCQVLFLTSILSHKTTITCRTRILLSKPCLPQQSSCKTQESEQPWMRLVRTESSGPWRRRRQLNKSVHGNGGS